MKIQDIVSDVRGRVESAGKPYQDAFKACVFAQRKAFGVVTRNGQTLANTEIGAAKNVFAAARASFDKARKDGVYKVVNNPQAYVPNGRKQIVSAYKDTIGLLMRTGNELTGVVSTGYKSVRYNLAPRASGTQAAATKSNGATTSGTRSRKSGAASGSAKKTAAGSTTAKRKTASTRKTASKSGSMVSGDARSNAKTASPASTSAASASDTAKTDSSSS